MSLSEGGRGGRPWPALGIGWFIALLVLTLAIVGQFVRLGVPHLELVLIAGLCLAVLL